MGNNKNKKKKKNIHTTRDEFLKRPNRERSYDSELNKEMDRLESSISDVSMDEILAERDECTKVCSSVINARIQKWLSEIENIGRKSTNLYGTLNEKQKKLISRIGKACMALSVRDAALEDVDLYKLKHVEVKKRK
jgi:hypothetical protein